MTTPDTSQAERTFIGCILNSPDQILSVNGVTEDMLDEPHHREIFKAVRAITAQQRKVSTPALLSVLPKDFADQGPAVAVIAVLQEYAKGAGSADEYSEVILERAAHRRIAKINEWTTEQARRGELTAEEIAASATRRLHEVLEISAPGKRERLADAARRAIRNAAKAGAAGETEAPGISTGVAALDDAIGKLYGLTFLLASQSEGKSALAAQIAQNAAEAGRPALIFQFEMDAEEMGAREIAARTGIPVADALAPQMDAFDRDQIDTAVEGMRKLPLFVIDQDKMTVDQIGAQCRAMDRAVGLSLVVIDQFDKIKSTGKHRDRFERGEEITTDLKSLAKSMPHVTFLVLGQRTRGSQKRDDDTPEINDADVPGIERNADVIFAVWQPANWLRRQKPRRNNGEELDKWWAELRRLEGKAEAILLKHRRRKAFTQCEMKFDGARMRFRGLAEEA